MNQKDHIVRANDHEDDNTSDRKSPNIEMNDITSPTSQPLLQSTENSQSSDEKNKMISDNENSINFNRMDNEISTSPSNNTNAAKSNRSDLLDRYNVVYIVLLLHGVATLMPWNMFINASEYFTEYKLKVKTEDGQLINSEFRDHFLSYLGICSQIPNVVFNVLNIFFNFGQGSKRDSFTVRILGAIIIELFFIIFTVILAIVDTSDMVTLFFYLTMTTVILLNTVNGIYQNSIYGLASCLPMKFTNAIVTGNNVCGTFTALMNIITIWLSPNKQIAAVYFFSSAIVVLIVAVVSFVLLKKNKYYRFYIENDGLRNIYQDSTNPNTEKGKTENQNLIRSGSSQSVNSKSKLSTYLFVFRHVWKQCLNVFLVFFVTLSVFPVIQSNIKPINLEYFGSTESTERYFVAVCCFLVFNASAMFGNIVPNFIIFPGPDRLWIPVVARFLFIPFFMFCNYVPDRRAWPVLIESDNLYLICGILFGLSSGYYSSLCMMYAPKSVPDSKHAGIAGMMAAACLVIGIFFGVNFSYVLAWLITTGGDIKM